MKFKSTTKAPLSLFKACIYVCLLLVLGGPYCKCIHFCKRPVCRSGELSKDTLIWADYNILFKPTSTQDDRDSYLNDLDNYLCDTLTSRYSGPRRILHDTCPCGPNFVNVKVVIEASGGSVSGNPPPTPPPGVSGASIQYFANNIKVQMPEIGYGIQPNSDTSIAGHILNPGKNKGKTILAIIDTGLDTLVYNTTNSTIGNWIWKDPNGNSQYNFIGGRPLDFGDDNAERHGTIVTAMALDMFKDVSVYPQLMILKALDKDGTGTIFSVTCALSYAICHHATVINASWGYYGAPDPNLLQCILNANSANIPVIAAAGNVDQPHVQNLICSANNLPDSLGKDLFYPACFTDTLGLTNLISVTNVSQSGMAPAGPCFYQNYSSKYISTGVLNQNNCCQYRGIPFLSGSYVKAEGSSFATPVISGLIDLSIEGGGQPPNATNWLQNHSQTAPAALGQYTMKGQYVIYKGGF